MPSVLSKESPNKGDTPPSSSSGGKGKLSSYLKPACSNGGKTSLHSKTAGTKSKGPKGPNPYSVARDTFLLAREKGAPPARVMDDGTPFVKGTSSRDKDVPNISDNYRQKDPQTRELMQLETEAKYNMHLPENLRDVLKELLDVPQVNLEKVVKTIKRARRESEWLRATLYLLHQQIQHLRARGRVHRTPWEAPAYQLKYTDWLAILEEEEKVGSRQFSRVPDYVDDPKGSSIPPEKGDCPKGYWVFTEEGLPKGFCHEGKVTPKGSGAKGPAPGSSKGVEGKSELAAIPEKGTPTSFTVHNPPRLEDMDEQGRILHNGKLMFFNPLPVRREFKKSCQELTLFLKDQVKGSLQSVTEAASVFPMSSTTSGRPSRAV